MADYDRGICCSGMIQWGGGGGNLWGEGFVDYHTSRASSAFFSTLTLKLHQVSLGHGNHSPRHINDRVSASRLITLRYKFQVTVVQ